MINIVVIGLTQTKLANLANTKVKRQVLVVFINFSSLPVVEGVPGSLEFRTPNGFNCSPKLNSFVIFSPLKLKSAHHKDLRLGEPFQFAMEKILVES